MLPRQRHHTAAGAIYCKHVKCWWQAGVSGNRDEMGYHKGGCQVALDHGMTLFDRCRAWHPAD